MHIPLSHRHMASVCPVYLQSHSSPVPRAPLYYMPVFSQQDNHSHLPCMPLTIKASHPQPTHLLLPITHMDQQPLIDTHGRPPRVPFTTITHVRFSRRTPSHAACSSPSSPQCTHVPLLLIAQRSFIHDGPCRRLLLFEEPSLINQRKRKSHELLSSLRKPMTDLSTIWSN